MVKVVITAEICGNARSMVFTCHDIKEYEAMDAAYSYVLRTIQTDFMSQHGRFPSFHEMGEILKTVDYAVNIQEVKENA